MRVSWKPGVRLCFALLLSSAIVRADADSETVPSDVQADSVVVLKRERKLILYSGGQMIRTYSVSLGGRPVGPKTRQGDHKTPEGRYVLDRRNASSRFYKSIHISYPKPEQVDRAKKEGVSAGGDVFIHGLPNGFAWLGSLQHRVDWTDGCIAVSNSEMDEIWRLVPDGTPIDIQP